MLKLNSIDKSVFAYNAANDETIGTGANAISRNKIIASGRTCLCEHMGNAIGGKKKAFNSLLKDFGGDYATLSKSHLEQKTLFCAARAYAAEGRPAPESIEQVRNDLSLRKNTIFLRTMSAIDSEVIAPMLPSIFSDLGGEMLNLRTVRPGRTLEINVMSNAAIIWEDGSFGSGHSTTKNYLYGETITLQPRMFTANATIKWFQMIASENGMDAGWYYAALIRGLWSKITAIYTSGLLAAAADTRFTPSYLQFNAYNSANWGSATTAVMLANGLRSRDQLMAFGEFSALQAVLPSGTPTDDALTMGLGEEWLKNGFVSMVNRVPLYEVLPALVPGYENTTGITVGLGDKIFIGARVGEGYAPMQGAIAEGWPLYLEYTPSETADFEISINASTLMDIKPVFASKFAVIDNVTL